MAIDVRVIGCAATAMLDMTNAMKRHDADHPIQCVVKINLSHSADAIFRKSELTLVAVVRSSHDMEFQPTHMIACSKRPVILSTKGTYGGQN